MDNSTIIYNEIIDAEETSFNEKNINCKTQNFYILLAFLLITIASLIIDTLYCYLIKCRAKQKHLLPFHDAKLKQVYINNIS